MKLDTSNFSSDTSGRELDITFSLERLQTDEQRQVLDTVAQIRKCGLESILSLPQLAVCGDQSAGKSSVLEALTEIPFPRNDNLCTRFATEIILRHAQASSLTIKVIPDTNRPHNEQETIRRFKESIKDFTELPELMDKAMILMEINNNSDSKIQSRAFARDVLSIEIEGPSRPQLTLVDLPGLIQNETKGVTQADVDMVAEITDHYISQHRTICLAVISATNDYANQGILTKVRKVDPKGERTLGIITKPDRLDPGSGSEGAFINLACNEDVFFKLGWHVLKNRSFEQGSSSFMERNASEATFFRTSNFKKIPKDCLGIDTLRDRLSQLLFEHVKQELPKLREDLDTALAKSRNQLEIMGNPRATAQDCRSYLMQLSMDYYEICKAAVDGHYEGDYFNLNTDQVFSRTSPMSIRRLRAVVQDMNTEFSNSLRTRGHKFHVAKLEILEGVEEKDLDGSSVGDKDQIISIPRPGTATTITYPQALKWVSQVLIRTRGRELSGNFNPLLVGELFWEQSSNWRLFAVDHVEKVAQVCDQFLEMLLKEKCPQDILSRLWSFQIRDVLKKRKDASIRELALIMEDVKSYPMNYNHYYTDTISARRQARGEKSLNKCISEAKSEELEEIYGGMHKTINIDVAKVIQKYTARPNLDMETYSSEEALDCLFSIYKVNLS